MAALVRRAVGLAAELHAVALDRRDAVDRGRLLPNQGRVPQHYANRAVLVGNDRVVTHLEQVVTDAVPGRVQQLEHFVHSWIVVRRLPVTRVTVSAVRASPPAAVLVELVDHQLPVLGVVDQVERVLRVQVGLLRVRAVLVSIRPVRRHPNRAHPSRLQEVVFRVAAVIELGLVDPVGIVALELRRVLTLESFPGGRLAVHLPDLHPVSRVHHVVHAVAHALDIAHPGVDDVPVVDDREVVTVRNLADGGRRVVVHVVADDLDPVLAEPVLNLASEPGALHSRMSALTELGSLFRGVDVPEVVVATEERLGQALLVG